MTTIRFAFLAGRYHATPWGHHVNEGLVEWPPSPWRLLRALLASGFAQEGWKGVDQWPPDARSLVCALAGVLPSYRLPRGGVAHTRHYMPFTEGKAEKTTKVLDTFLRFGLDEALLVHWPAELTAAQRTLLERLLSGIAYLGRAEAWVEASLVADLVPDASWARPSPEGAPVDLGWEQVPLLAPVPAESYTAWRASRQPPPAPASKGKRKARVEEDPAPADLLSCLTMETTDLQSLGWSQPPGSRRVLYLRPADSLEPAVAAPRRAPVRREPVECALLALSPDTVSGTLLPRMSRCLPQAEHLHAALVHRLGANARCEALTGRGADGAPLEGHRHAHLLPLDLDEDGRLDHVLVWAPMGLDVRAQDAVLGVERTWGKDVPPIVVTCAGMGSLADVRRQLRDRRGRLPAILGAGAGGLGRRWSSVTPFIVPRPLKTHGPKTLVAQVRTSCVERGLPEPVEINVLERHELVGRGFLRFVRARSEGRPQPPSTVPWCLRLTFAKPVRGPVALGYGSHFGLGLFMAEE